MVGARNLQHSVCSVPQGQSTWLHPGLRRVAPLQALLGFEILVVHRVKGERAQTLADTAPGWVLGAERLSGSWRELVGGPGCALP